MKTSFSASVVSLVDVDEPLWWMWMSLPKWRPCPSGAQVAVIVAVGVLVMAASLVLPGGAVSGLVFSK
jgi:hypothetical protein